ncbi:MAG: hypothetical protein Q8S75_10385, partial [Nitrospirota bacterium]|nr:hypothetical protein [Nitrospirota bacterium]
LVVKSGTRGQFVLMATLPIIFLPISRTLTSMKTYVSGVLLVACLASVTIFAYDSLTHQDERWSSGKFQSDWNLRVNNIDKLLHHWLKASNGDPAVLVLGLGNSASFSPRIIGFYPHMMLPEVLGEEGLLGVGLLGLAVWVSIRSTRRAYHLAKDDEVQRGILATLSACFAFAFLLSFKQGSLVGFSAEIFSFAILIERQGRLLVSSQRIQIDDASIEPTLPDSVASASGPA